mgnify:CR=1 FL=1
MVLVAMPQQPSTKLTPTKTVFSAKENSPTSSTLPVVLVSEELVISVHLRTNHHHSQAQVVLIASVLVVSLLVVLKVSLLVEPSVLVVSVEQAASKAHHSNHHHHHQEVLISLPSAKPLVIQHKPMLPGQNMALKFVPQVSMSMLTHKSSHVKLQVVFKLIHKTLEFDFFNHQLFHHQA